MTIHFRLSTLFRKHQTRKGAFIGIILAIIFAFGLTSSALAATGAAGEAYNYYLRALLLESQGNMASAQEQLELALGLAPESAYLHRTAAEFALRLGQVNRAVEEIEKANELDPKDVKALVLAGQIHWALGDTAKAEAKLKRAVDLNPNEREALVNLAGALTPKDPQKAIDLYKEFLGRHPGEVDIYERLAQLYQATGDLKLAEKTWDKVLEWAPSSPRAHLALAQIAEVNFDTATAVAHYETVMSEDPSNLPLLLRVGELRYRNNEMSKAYEAFTKAQAIAPDSASVNFWLALLSEQRGDWEEAIRLMKQIAARSSEPGVLLRLSYYYSQAGKTREAVKVLEELSKSDPENLDFLGYLAAAYEQNKQFPQAEKALLRFVDMSPDDPAPHFQLGTLYDRMGRWKKAEEELKAAIRLKPDYHVALNYLAYSYADRNVQLTEAESLMTSALGLDPENAAYLDSMGWVYYRLGKYEKATDFLQAAAARARDPLIWDHLGDVLMAKGEIGEAVLAWDESLRIDPRGKGVESKMKQALARLPVRDTFDLFYKRALTHFSDVKSINGLVSVNVCEGKRCFESKARISYDRDGDMRLEIPGPLSGPIMLVTKSRDGAVKYGAIHPLFQTVEYHVTRAFGRMESLLSADLFRKSDLSTLEQQAKIEGRWLQSTAGSMKMRFARKDGDLFDVSWIEGGLTETLRLAPYERLPGKGLPVSLEWKDESAGFRIEMRFLDPVIVVVPAAANEPVSKNP